MTTVSAIISTYNRAPDLRRCLRELKRQTRCPNEILVIDDASTDDTRTMMAREFSDVRYVRTPKNMGQGYNRNLGVMSTTGDFILSLDDDAWFESPNGLADAVECLEAHSEAGALALNVRLPNGWLWFPPSMTMREVSHYIGCGVLLRRDVAERTLYVPATTWSEELDRTLRIYGMGLCVLGVPEPVIYHALSLANRNWARFRFAIHRSGLIRELMRCPLRLLPWRFLRRWLGNTWHNFKGGYYLTDLKVLLSLPFILWVGFRNRAPVSVAAYRRWAAIVAADALATSPGQGPKDLGHREP